MPRAPLEAPDAIEPVLGWRVWDVVRLDGSLRLCSLNFWTIWVPRSEATAVCRRALLDTARARLPEHAAPEARCTCGIYATQTPRQALEYAAQFPLRSDTVGRIAGRVSLWGTVVECETGWRGERAYPSTLFVASLRRRRRFARPPASRIPAEEVALGLVDYGVPVEVVDAESARDLARRLEPSPG